LLPKDAIEWIVPHEREIDLWLKNYYTGGIAFGLNIIWIGLWTTIEKKRGKQ
jgi:hypothetical protein